MHTHPIDDYGIPEYLFIEWYVKFDLRKHGPRMSNIPISSKLQPVHPTCIHNIYGN